VGFIGWSLLIQGVIFALIGLMPTLWLLVSYYLSPCSVGSRICCSGNLTDAPRPRQSARRVSTTDRATEMLVWTFSTAIAGWSLYRITRARSPLFLVAVRYRGRGLARPFHHTRGQLASAIGQKKDPLNSRWLYLVNNCLKPRHFHLQKYYKQQPRCLVGLFCRPHLRERAKIVIGWECKEH